MYKAVALIPARSGSKRIKDKNILKINGHPLLAYTIKAAIQCKLFNKVICVTDSKKYAKIAKKYGAEVPLLRPKSISHEKSPDIEWVTWIMKILNKKNNYDIFSILRPTSPFRNTKTIKRAWNKFIKKKNYDSLRAIEKCKQHPGKMWKIKKNLIYPILKNKINKIPSHSRQYPDLPKIYIQNASLEIAWTKVLNKKQPSIAGKKIIPFLTKKNEGFDINDQEDLIIMKHFLKSKKFKIQKI
jgi:CMP-N,N'-diacetyllegionaminic acid synthase